MTSYSYQPRWPLGTEGSKLEAHTLRIGNFKRERSRALSLKNAVRDSALVEACRGSRPSKAGIRASGGLVHSGCLRGTLTSRGDDGVVLTSRFHPTCHPRAWPEDLWRRKLRCLLAEARFQLRVKVLPVRVLTLDQIDLPVTGVAF